MRHPFREHIAETICAARRAARQGGAEIDLASAAIRMARIATAVHLSESARLRSSSARQAAPEEER